MSPQSRRLAFVVFALFPLQAWPQATEPVPGDPLALGRVLQGEERSFQVRGRVDFGQASTEEVRATAQRVTFSISEDSGFCVAISAPGETTAFSLIGQASGSSELLFDVGTGVGGLASELGRRSLIASVAPIEPTAFVLGVIVGQSELAPGDTMDIFLRAYPDTTSAEELGDICGAPFSVRGALPPR